MTRALHYVAVGLVFLLMVGTVGAAAAAVAWSVGAEPGTIRAFGVFGAIGMALKILGDWP